MNFIRKKEIKFFKLFLISPWLGQTIDLFYLISLPLIIFKFINYSDFINNYSASNNVYEFFEGKSLFNITEKTQFFEYVKKMTYKIYDFKTFPMFISIGSLRIKKYSLIEDCYDINPECRNSFTCKFN